MTAAVIGVGLVLIGATAFAYWMHRRKLASAEAELAKVIHIANREHQQHKVDSYAEDAKEKTEQQILKARQDSAGTVLDLAEQLRRLNAQAARRDDN